MNLCVACLHETPMRLTWDNLEVHHIVKLVDDFDMRLDEANLITLCKSHHERAEDGTISKDQLREWIKPDIGRATEVPDAKNER